MMPNSVDVSKIVQLSTLPNWSEVANWYADMSATQAKTDYEVDRLAETLVPAGSSFSELEKARIIYNYIVKEIRYSQVPFRQGAYVPQRAAKVIRTKLGDCKDVATLYAALGRKVGLTVNLVLLDTRDNGKNDMLLPSVEFNHCIVKVKAGAQDWYLELTDANLPFGCLPNYDLQALALEIPFGQPAKNATLFQLNPPNRLPDSRNQVSEVRVAQRNLNINSAVVRVGATTVSTRDYYQSLSAEKRFEAMQEAISGSFTTPVDLKNVEFSNLAQLQDSLSYSVQYQVRNEVLEIGDLKSFKIPYHFVFLKADAFASEKRVHPINYWQYEDCDAYNEDLTVILPEGTHLVEVPKDVSLEFNGTHFSIRFEQPAPGKLHVVRQIQINRADISSADYPAFRAFVEAVLAAESKYIAFK
jgi:hypothetical protein